MPEASTPSTSTDLDARYGRNAQAQRKNRAIIIATAVGFVTVFTAWLVWGGLLEAPAQFEAKDTGFVLVDDSTVTVEWNFNVPENTEARCAIQALNSTFAIVGWKIVDVPASELRNRTLTETVRTTEQAVSGLIYRCWLT